MLWRTMFSRSFATEDLPGGEDVWKVSHGFYFRDTEGKKHYVKSGTITDGASIPKILWSVIGHPRETDIGQAAAVHDVLYRKGGISRKRCDEILIEGMECLKASWTKRTLVYYGLRVGGWKAWNMYRQKEGRP
jgi:hypothetical protein